MKTINPYNVHSVFNFADIHYSYLVMSTINYLVDVYHIFDSGGLLHWNGVMKHVLHG